MSSPFLFDNLAVQMCRISILIVFFFITNTQGCQQRNISCDHIKTDDGFEFQYQCPENSEIFVDHDKTPFAYRELGNHSFECSREVISIDNRTVVTRGCQDLQVKCIFPNGEKRVKETCMEYKITGKPSFGNIMDAAQQSSWDEFECNTNKGKLKRPEPDDSPTWYRYLIIGVPLVLVIFGIVGMLCCCYSRWKKKQHGAATVPELVSYLRTGGCLRKNSPAERGEELETGAAECDSIQEVTAGDSGTQQNGVKRTSVMSASGLRGCGENDIEHDDTLGNVLVHSIDLNADGTTPQSFSLDHNLSNGGIELAENGDVSAPDVNGAANRRAMHRSLRDDPGGVRYNKDKDVVQIMKEPSGWTHGGHGREDHGREVQPLLSDHGAASQGFDMTGGAAASDQVSRCSSAQDTDVESTPKIKNCGQHIN
ncbi:uncharacterized protein LOC126405223 [Epinephelus moara]|uniref:uncharacterized protein LOC126405223 n=1 Tax=Epinephelus moara TaxID=300413 RepID=UPI00214DF541|nr:uncharacterized protein LOC126405223 [Epinephelus moara]